MKIIIEGCDGSGKSTLANRLAKTYGMVVEHDSQPQDYASYAQRLMASGNVVFDRFFLGQFVYNAPEERKLTWEELDKLVDLCATMNVLFIYLDTDKKTIMKRFKHRSTVEKQKDEFMMHKMNLNNLDSFVEVVKFNYELALKHCASIMIRARGVK